MYTEHLLFLSDITLPQNYFVSLTNSMANTQSNCHGDNNQHHHIEGDIDAGVGPEHVLSDQVVLRHQITDVHIGQCGVVITEWISTSVTLYTIILLIIYLRGGFRIWVILK